MVEKDVVWGCEAKSEGSKKVGGRCASRWVVRRRLITGRAVVDFDIAADVGNGNDNGASNGRFW